MLGKTWQARTSTLMVLCCTMGAFAPLLIPLSATAQLFPSSGQIPSEIPRFTVRAGQKIPVRYEEAEKILLTREETVPLTLTVAANLRDSQRRMIIPAGSQIVGQIEPVPDEKGMRFVAEELIIENAQGTQRIAIDGSSEVVTRTEEIERGTNTGSILQGAAIGAAAATVISTVTGSRRLNVGTILGGAGAGALGGYLLGGRNKAELISIYPEEDLGVILRSSLSLY
ncbi:hypothetical protein K4A83_04905 [Spirulina subsalsa FACHB-351]|uniref:Glycine zipper domain-containing protein n=2 Tax=Spirulina subsalsa TaxID=54311 RepID=A0ABT3L287_9CYAN|nr:hypothetical protein [Spirulina subsalsa FACHB-351]